MDPHVGSRIKLGLFNLIDPFKLFPIFVFHRCLLRCLGLGCMGELKWGKALRPLLPKAISWLGVEKVKTLLKRLQEGSIMRIGGDMLVWKDSKNGKFSSFAYFGVFRESATKGSSKMKDCRTKGWGFSFSNPLWSGPNNCWIWRSPFIWFFCCLFIVTSFTFF